MYKKIASNTIAQIFSKILTAIISIFLIGILTKYLPIELYGSYNKIYSYLWIFAFLADLGLYTIAIREISQGHTSKEKIIWNILSLRTVLWLGIWALALLIALFLPWYHDSLSLWAIAIVGAFTLVSLINSSLLALMQSQMKMEFSVFSLIFWKLLNLGLIALILLFIFTDPQEIHIAFLWVFVAGFLWVLSNTILNYLYLSKEISLRYRWDTSYIYYIFKISLPYGIALFLSIVYFKVDIILLSLLESPEKADISIALYGLPMKIIEVLMVLGAFYLNSLLPTLSKKYSEKKYEEISHIFGLSAKILLSFGLCIFLMGNLFAEQTISIIATQQYITPEGSIYNSIDALRVVLAVLLFYFLSLVCIYMLIASERQSILLWINIIVTVCNIVWNILVIPSYSFIGAAYVTLLSQMILLLLSAYVVFQHISFPKKYMLSMWATLVWGTILFFLFYRWSALTHFSSLVHILLFAPLFFGMYICGEYYISKNILPKKYFKISQESR